MSVTVKEISRREDVIRFIDFPWFIYRNDPNWIPPLKKDIWDIVTGKDNPLFRSGPHALFMAQQNGRVLGRAMTAIDEELNAAKGRGWGYFSLFESVDDREVATSLLGTCEKWLSEHGAKVSRGPVSPDNGDDYRGLLIDGFESPPVLMDSYNPRYYANLIESAGYKGDGDDRLAYYYSVKDAVQGNTEKTIDYAKARWKFRVDRADLKNLESEFRDLKTIIDESMPDWPDMIPPSMEEIELMAKKVLPFADADLIYIARTLDDRPIGFLLGMPDYNQVLRHLNGSVFPLGWAKFLWFRRMIKAARVFVLFVVPEYQKKAVSHAMFLEAFKACKRKGYQWVEGSTIVESNTPMNRDALGAGGRLYKRFRTYEKRLG